MSKGEGALLWNSKLVDRHIPGNTADNGKGPPSLSMHLESLDLYPAAILKFCHLRLPRAKVSTTDLSLQKILVFWCS